MKIKDYPDESDPGPYPVPDDMIENWPLQRNEDAGALLQAKGKLDDIQRHGAGDRHGIVVDPVNGLLYEFYQARKTDAGWEGAGFDLRFKIQPDAPRTLDFGGRGRAADLSRHGALRRMRARDGDARNARHGAADAASLRLSGATFRQQTDG